MHAIFQESFINISEVIIRIRSFKEDVMICGEPQVWENRESRVSLGVNDITKWGFMSMGRTEDFKRGGGEILNVVVSQATRPER